MPRRGRVQSTSPAKRVSLSAFDFRGDEVEKARVRLLHSARAKKRKRSVLGLHTVTPPGEDAEEDLASQEKEGEPAAKKRRRTSVRNVKEAKEDTRSAGDLLKQAQESHASDGEPTPPSSRKSRRRSVKAAIQKHLSARGKPVAKKKAKRSKSSSTPNPPAADAESPNEGSPQMLPETPSQTTGQRTQLEYVPPPSSTATDSTVPTTPTQRRSARRLKPSLKMLQGASPVKVRRRTAKVAPIDSAARTRGRVSGNAENQPREKRVRTPTQPTESEAQSSPPQKQDTVENADQEKQIPEDDIFASPAVNSKDDQQASPSNKPTPVHDRLREEPGIEPLQSRAAASQDAKPSSWEAPDGQSQEVTPPRPREEGSVLPASQRRLGVKKEDQRLQGRSPIRNNDDIKDQQQPMSKRVRFSEPHRSHRSVRMDLMSFMKRKKRRIGASTPVDVAVVGSGSTGQDERSRQVLLDELQYILDGIFKSSERKDKTPATISLIRSSLQELTELLLRKPKKPRSCDEPEFEDNCGVVLQILATQPDLLKKIVVGLFRILGMSRALDVLVSLVFVILFRSTASTLAVEESFLDSLIGGFLRNSAECLNPKKTASATGGEESESERMQTGQQRRSTFGRGLSGAKKERTVIAQVNDLLRKAGIKDETFQGFSSETDGSSFLMALALSLLLEAQEKARVWMRSNQRLHKIVVVLYSCQRVLQARSTKSGESQEARTALKAEEFEEHCPMAIITGSAMRVLEFATLDQTCQLRIATESRVCQVILDFVRAVSVLDHGVVVADPLICQALRLAINLGHNCKPGTQEFVAQGGPRVILDCLARECVGAGLIEGSVEGDQREEAFDVRVLCLAVLISILDKEDDVRMGFRDLCPRDIPEREGGAITMILELLKNVGRKQKETMEARRREDAMTEGETPMRGESQDQMSDDEVARSEVMEGKITTGYICLLLGALAHDCETNKQFMKATLPQQSMLGVAAVLTEFLDFHHEVGVTSVAMDSRYRSIISNLVKDAELPMPSLLQHGTGEDGDVKDEGSKSEGDSDFKAQEEGCEAVDPPRKADPPRDQPQEQEANISPGEDSVKREQQNAEGNKESEADGNKDAENPEKNENDLMEIDSGERRHAGEDKESEAIGNEGDEKLEKTDIGMDVEGNEDADEAPGRIGKEGEGTKRESDDEKSEEAEKAVGPLAEKTKTKEAEKTGSGSEWKRIR